MWRPEKKKTELMTVAAVVAVALSKERFGRSSGRETRQSDAREYDDDAV
jgi:hypothetical protein